MIGLSSAIKRNPELVSTDVDGEKVMMSVENGEYFGLDPVGSRIWELIENPIRIESLINLLLEEFDVSREQCENDSFEFLNELLEKNLLVVID
ncbi:MAG: lasso peptide biosynthesis PqqD family chaperone [Bacteroidales bacterium]|nr:MAG: lasso peptide biosynthesis PqqD family chaperone [Bacteroidales bacterium]